MAKLGSAIVFINAELGQFSKDLANAERMAKASVGNIARTMGNIGKNMTIVGGGITTALAGITHSFVTAAGEIDELNEKTGIGVEALSELKYAATLTGGSLEDLERATKKMATVIVAAADGGAAAEDALGRLGLKYDDLKDKNPTEQFEMLLKGIAGIENPTMRAAAAQEIFGRAGTSLLPMLAKGQEGLDAMRAEAESLGLVMSREDILNATNFEDNVFRIKAALAGVAYAIARDVLPMIQELGPKIIEIIGKFREWINENGDLIQVIAKVGVALAIGGPLLIGLSHLLFIGTQMAAMFGAIGKGTVLFGTALGGAGALFVAGGAGIALALGLAALAETFYKIMTGAPEASNAISRFFDKILSFVPGLKEFKDLLYDIAYWIARLPARALNAVFGDTPDISASQARLASLGKSIGADASYNAYATGTNFHPGGMAWVGERGPELVNLPRGSQVFDAQTSRGMLGDVKIDMQVNVSPGMPFDAEREATNIQRAISRVRSRRGGF